MQDNNKQGILLETGTNEFEIIEFTVGKINYGINVAKVREVINMVEITKMPNAHPYVDGVFTLRGRLMPLVNLSTCLGVEAKNDDEKKIIVTEINNYYMGFLVNEVSRIYRISWESMEPVPDIANSDMVVGIIKMDQKMIILLDFEKILSEINPEISKKFQAVPKSSKELEEQRQTKHVMIAEDSTLLRDLLVGTLHEAGYVNIDAYPNGKEAWEVLERLADTETAIEDKVDLLITDIEMPQMDGHNLLKRIRANKVLQSMPVVIFSSLINDEMRRKGESIGANAQISKPEITQLIDIADKIIFKLK